MKRVALLYGIVAGLLIAVYGFSLYVWFGNFASMSVEQFQIAEIFSSLRYLFLLLAVMFAIMSYKAAFVYDDQFISLFKVGFITSLLIAASVGLMKAGIMLLHPSFFEHYILLGHHSGGYQHLTLHPSDILRLHWLYTPAGNGLFHFAETLFTGGCISAIFSFVFCTRPSKYIRLAG